MAYEPLTQSQYQKARNAGYSDQQILEFEKRRKQEAQEVPVVPEAPESKGIGGALKSVLTGTAEQYGESARKIVSEGEKLYEKGSTAGLKDIGQFALRTTGEVAKSALAPIGKALEATGIAPAIGKGIAKVHETGMKSPTYQNVWEQLQRTGQSYSEWKEQNPDAAENIESAAEIGLFLIGEKPLQKGVEAGLKGTKAASTAITKTGEAIGKGVQATGTGIKEAGKVVKAFPAQARMATEFVGKEAKEIAGAVKPAIKTAKELKEAVPAFYSKVKENVPIVGEKLSMKAKDVIERDKLLKSSSPAMQKAIKFNLDEKLIHLVDTSDDLTKQAFKKVVNLAEEASKKSKAPQPTIVAGELAENQAGLLFKERKRIGEEIGKVIDNLSTTQKVSMKQEHKILDDILSAQGIKKELTETKLVGLDFSGTKFTPAQRTKINELYKLANEGGDILSPRQIKNKDELFSQLQREANFDGIGRMMVKTPEGDKNLFQAFRDVYNSKLDQLSPKIRSLNKEYGEIARLIEDIENSIFKTPNFHGTKATDPAEFAKTNLRRIFGEAQSSPVYKAIADQMDAMARTLGYKNAAPSDVSDFAQMLRTTLYPKITPHGGMTGVIHTALGGTSKIQASPLGVLSSVLEAGTPNIKQQRQALMGLLKEKK